MTPSPAVGRAWLESIKDRAHKEGWMITVKDFCERHPLALKPCKICEEAPPPP